MIKIYNSSEIDKSEILSRSGQNDLEKAEKTVREIISDVRARGDVAVRNTLFVLTGVIFPICA